MSNGRGVETPANKIATSLATLELAMRLNAEIVSGRINTSIYLREVTVVTNRAGLRLPPFPAGTAEDLASGAFNLVLIALGASALSADETLDEVFGKVSSDVETSRIGIRIVVNQLRNAFAHNPWRPRWAIRPKYRNAYAVVLNERDTFVFDATRLDGDGVRPDHIGGLEFWVKLLQHCERLVS